MKILYLIMCIVILSSCSAVESNSLTLPLDTNAEFTDGTLTVEGRLFFDGEKMIFSNNGYNVTITEKGGEIEYDGIVFRENVIPSSRFLPLYNMLCESFNNNLKSSSFIEKENLKITFLKDTP